MHQKLQKKNIPYNVDTFLTNKKTYNISPPKKLHARFIFIIFFIVIC